MKCDSCGDPAPGLTSPVEQDWIDSIRAAAVGGFMPGGVMTG